MRENSKYEKLCLYLLNPENSHKSDLEIGKDTGITSEVIKVYLHRLKRKKMITITYEYDVRTIKVTNDFMCRGRGSELFNKCWEEATVKGDKIPVQCTFEFGEIKEISTLAFAYYFHYHQMLEDEVARKRVPKFKASEWRDYI